jgi:hypothetical protein
MGKLKVDQIQVESASSIELLSPLTIKSYTAAEIALLSGMSNGDLIYDSDNAVLKVYKTNAWVTIIPATLTADTINEETTDAGVTIESVRMENGFVINGDSVASMSIGATDRAMLAGPVDITGTVTVENGGNLVIV